MSSTFETNGAYISQFPFYIMSQIKSDDKKYALTLIDAVGVKIVVWLPFETEPRTLWRAIPNLDGYSIFNALNNQCLTYYPEKNGVLVSPGQKIGIEEFEKDRIGQIWKFKNVDKDSINILTSLNTNYCVDIQNSNLDSYTIIYWCSDKNDQNQEFSIHYDRGTIELDSIAYDIDNPNNPTPTFADRVYGEITLKNDTAADQHQDVELDHEIIESSSFSSSTANTTTKTITGSSGFSLNVKDILKINADASISTTTSETATLSEEKGITETYSYKDRTLITVPANTSVRVYKKVTTGTFQVPYSAKLKFTSSLLNGGSFEIQNFAGAYVGKNATKVQVIVQDVSKDRNDASSVITVIDAVL